MWSADPVPRWTHYGRWDADGLAVRHCPDCRNACDFVIFRLPAGLQERVGPLGVALEGEPVEHHL